MKLKSLRVLALALLAGATIVSCGQGGANSTQPGISTENQDISIEEGQSQLWLDRYGEMDLPIVGDKTNLTYDSENPAVAIVKEGRVYAQGKGETNVTASNGRTTLTFHVKVRDSGVRPTIIFRDLEAYLNDTIALPQKVSYNGEPMDTEIEYRLDIKDTSIATYENGLLRGHKLGKTTADVTADYKGLKLARRDVPIEVREVLYISASSQEIDIYETSTKLGHYDLDAVAYEKGLPVEDAAIEYSIIEGKEHIRLEGKAVYAVSPGEAKIKASYSAGVHKAEYVFQIHVGPNYIETAFVNESSKDVTFKPAKDPSGSRENVYEYRPDPKITDANCFESSIYIQDREGTVVDLYRAGKRYLAYDLYYESNQNLMVGCYNITSWISVGDYFRKNYLTILKDGEVTNRLEKGSWITVVYDLKGLWMMDRNLKSSFFFFVNDPNAVCYLSSPRFYLDDTFLPDENRHYEKKDGYVQATNDEFDVQLPISKGYTMSQKEPTVVVDPKEVPTYAKEEGTKGGREGAYTYRTKTNSSTKNALVVSTSMNETYDDSLYQMSKHGNYFSFDIYPTKNSVLEFAINGGFSSYRASLTVGDSNLGEYENWLVAYAGKERLSTLIPNQWQTIVYSFSDNYLDGCTNGQMTFSSATKGDEVHIDNVRYHADDAFIPSDYAIEERRPVAANPETSITRLTTGDFRGAYEVKGENNAKVSFNGVDPNSSFFKDGNRYVKFDLFLSREVTSISLFSHAESGLENKDALNLSLNSPLPSIVHAFDEQGLELSALKAGAWLTLYLEVVPNGSPLTNLDVGVELHGQGQVTSYFRYVSFKSQIYGLYVRQDQPGVSENVSLDFLQDGEFKNAYRYENRTSGELPGNAQNWGESGVRFEGVTAKDDSSSGAVIKSGYRFIKTDIYFEESTTSFSIRATMDRNFTNYWYRDLKIGATLPSEVSAVDANGKRVSSFKHNRWYSLYLPLDYSSSDTGWSCVSLYTNGGSVESPSVMYLRNTEYLKETSIPELVPADIIAKGNYPAYVSCEEMEDGSFRYQNATSGQLPGNAQNWGESGVFFHNVTDPYANEEKDSTGAFFDEGYHYIKVDVKFERAVSFAVRATGTAGMESYWKQEIAFNTTVDDDLLLFEMSGSKATTIAMNTWYTLYIPVLYTEGYQGWSDVCIYTNGGSVESPSVMYLRNVSFLKNM